MAKSFTRGERYALLVTGEAPIYAFYMGESSLQERVFMERATKCVLCWILDGDFIIDQEIITASRVRQIETLPDEYIRLAEQLPEMERNLR